MPDDAPPAPVTLRTVAAPMGTYALHTRGQIDLAALKRWKAGDNPALTDRMAADITTAFRARANVVASVTVPAPNRARGRDYDTHPVAEVAHRVGSAIGVPFVRAFAPRTAFVGRGVGRSKLTLPPLEHGADLIPLGAVLVVDDAITTRATITQAVETLHSWGHPTYAIAWVNFGA